MIYFYILIALFLLSSITNALVFSKRIGNSIFIYLSETEDNRTYLDKKNEKLVLIFSFMLFVIPGFIYKEVKTIPLEDSTLSFIVLFTIVVLSFFCLWCSVKKVGAKSFGIKRVKPTILINSLKTNFKERTNFIDKQLEVINKKIIKQSFNINSLNFY